MDMAAGARIGMDGVAAAPIPTEFGLSALDWRVVALARAEADRFGTRAFDTRSATGRLFDRLIGVESGMRRLADDRLEALRRFVGLSRRSDRRAASAAAALSDLGISMPAIEFLRSAAIG